MEVDSTGGGCYLIRSSSLLRTCTEGIIFYHWLDCLVGPVNFRN